MSILKKNQNGFKGIKQTIEQFIPPIISELIKSNSAAESHPKYSTYQEALKLCTTNAYEEAELIEVILKKTKRFSDNFNEQTAIISNTNAYSLLSLINPVIESKSNHIKVLDFGGACGAHYFQLRNLLDKRLKLSWIVVETPEMVKQAKVLETDELSFTSDFELAVNKLGEIDLLHTSGTLQCVEKPYEYLTQILQTNAKWILFNRLGLNKLDRDVITIHSSKLSWNGIGDLPEGYTDRWIRYPFNFPSESKFVNKIREHYAITAKFEDKSGMYNVKGEDIIGYGLLCQRHKA